MLRQICSLLLLFTVHSLTISCSALPKSRELATDDICTTRAPASDGILCSDIIGTDTISHEQLKMVFGPPRGILVREESIIGRTSQPAAIYKDEIGQKWYLKEDLKFAELQTSAEVISSWIYRSFGYFAPETYIVHLAGRRYSASKLLPTGVDSTLQNSMPNTRNTRVMRVVAAFLKDWDRLRVGPNNRIFSDNSIALYDFGGTLGARAQGGHKPGGVFSEAIGSYLPTSDLREIYDSFDVSWLPKSHPWRAIDMDDINYAVEIFREFDRRKIEEIVELAQFSDRRNQIKMIEALTSRRDAIVDGLRTHFNSSAQPISTSYWATKVPIQNLSFEVEANRPQIISKDIRSFVNSLKILDDHIVLFRGQEGLTQNVLSPMARKDLSQGKLKSETEQWQQYLAVLNQLQTDQTISNSIPSNRSTAYKYLSLSFGNNPDMKYNSSTWWSRATPVDALAMYHTGSNGHEILVSATRSLAIASRYVKFPRVEYKYRYIYVLVVPKTKVVPVLESISAYHGAPNKEEKENSIIYDATPYITGVYDSETGQFVTKM